MVRQSLVNTLSFFAPIIIASGVLIFSLFSASVLKGLFFLFWLLVVTGARISLLWSLGVPTTSSTIGTNPVCLSGEFLPYDNSTYSVFVLCFTFFYFTMPMFLSDNINYIVLIFFISYILFDIAIKKANACILNPVSLIGDIIGGGGLAVAIVSLIYSTPVSKYLFINEINTNKEICNMPSKQTFRCSVYKNGELVSSSLTA